MKRAIALLALIVVAIPEIHGQTLALANRPVLNTPNSGYFAAYRYKYHKKLNPNILIGGIVASSGLIITGIGALYYSTAFDTYSGTGVINPSREHAGEAVMIAGGAIAIVGFTLMIIGKVNKQRSYSWEVIAPKQNEIGLAYNF